jgi:tRNA 2-thiouridine synthesizing protein A
MQIDARGMSCPQPVLMTKKALKDNPEVLEIRVDNNTAKGNVERFLKSAGYAFETENQDGNYVILARR